MAVPARDVRVADHGEHGGSLAFGAVHDVEDRIDNGLEGEPSGYSKKRFVPRPFKDVNPCFGLVDPRVHGFQSEERTNHRQRSRDVELGPII